MRGLAVANVHVSRVRIIATLVIVVGAILIVAGVVTWFAVRSQLAAEHITVSQDASAFAGDEVDGPFTAYVEANTIEKHALDATGGKTYAELAQNDPKRQTAMTASFLRASLYTSVVAFGVAAMAAAIGVVLILIGWALRSVVETDARMTSPPTTA
jgi:hypothetical protein